MRLTAALHGASLRRSMLGRAPAARPRGSLSRYAVTAASVLFALAIGLQSAVAQQASSALRSKAPEAAAIATAAQADGHVRVIVLLNAPNVANQVRPNAATIASIKARVAVLQNNVLAKHFGDAVNLRPGRGFVRHHTRFEITPGFVVEVDAAELEALAADPQVKSINVDHARPPTLLQSVPLIGQPTAYANGATGNGWAVAVLDTGVQANHEFLSGKVVAEACFSNANGNGGGISLCPNGLNSQTGVGAADSTITNCINGSSNLCLHGTHVA
jgi:subtilisin family serine protease